MARLFLIFKKKHIKNLIMELHNLNLLEWQQLAYKKILSELNNIANYLSIY